MKREQVLAVLYDLAMVIGGEVALRPLLTRCVQRLLYHTSFPAGIVVLEPLRPAGEAVQARLELAIGDHGLAALAGRPLALPRALVAGEPGAREDPALLAGLPSASPYGAYLRLPIPGQGVIVLLAPRLPEVELKLADVFQPVMANLARAMMLCRDHERHEAGLVAERDEARLGFLESAETVRAIAEAAPDAIVMSDADARITYWNPAAARMFGWSADEVLGHDLHATLAPAPYRRRADAAFHAFRDTGAGRALGATHEYEAMRKDGSAFPVELSLAALQLGGRPAALGVVRDVTERRRAQEQLRRSQRLDALGQLAGGVAHDFNNLLVVINGCCELALAEVPGGAPVRADLEQIQAAGKRAAALTRQLLAFGRRQTLNPVVLSPNAVVTGLGELLRRVIGEDIELRTRLAPDAANVLADPWQLEQVLVNLVVNARDAMPSGGVLTIETRNATLDAAAARAHGDVPPGAWLVLEISDTGVGMDAATVARMFEPFFTTKPAGKGTGLGLATVYGIVRQSGGHIEVHSAPGAGTTMSIYLPRDARDAPELAGGAGAAAAPRARAGESVLVVEDDPGVRALAARVLQPLGYEVLTAATPLEALELSRGRSEPIQLLLSDVVMPGMDGLELAELLGRERRGLAVLFMSGHGDVALAGRGGASGDAALLEKPFAAAELAQRVREALDRARRPAEVLPA